MKIINWIVIIVSMSLLVNAFGVGIPYDNEFDFVPNGEQSIQFVVINKEKRAVQVEFLVDTGELGDIVELSHDRLKVEGESQKSMTLTIKYPEILPVGKHTIFVRTMSASKSGGSAGARISIKRRLIVNVEEGQVESIKKTQRVRANKASKREKMSLKRVDGAPRDVTGLAYEDEESDSAKNVIFAVLIFGILAVITLLYFNIRKKAMPPSNAAFDMPPVKPPSL